MRCIINKKRCCLCKKDLPVSEFKSNKRRKDGLQGQCIDCQKKYRRKHYLQNRRKYINKAANNKNIFLKWWKEYKKLFKCTECEEDHPACIDFHHKNSLKKDIDISILAHMGNKNRLLKEIKKCIPLCSNCHRKKHWEERKS